MARGKGRAVRFGALVLSLTLALAHRASAQVVASTCTSYAKRACRKNDACQWTGSSCVVPSDACSGIQAKKVGGVSKKRRCNGKTSCRCSKKKKCGPCVADVAVGAPNCCDGVACSFPWPVTPGLTCGMVKITPSVPCDLTPPCICPADWISLSCIESGATCTGPDRTGGNQLIAGEMCTYIWKAGLGGGQPVGVNPQRCVDVGRECLFGTPASADTAASSSGPDVGPVESASATGGMGAPTSRLTRDMSSTMGSLPDEDPVCCKPYVCRSYAATKRMFGRCDYPE